MIAPSVVADSHVAPFEGGRFTFSRNSRGRWKTPVPLALEQYLEEFIVSNFPAIFKRELEIYEDAEGNDGRQWSSICRFFHAIGGPSQKVNQDLNEGDIIWLVPQISDEYRLEALHWEVLSLEDSSDKLLAAKTVKRREFEEALARQTSTATGRDRVNARLDQAILQYWNLAVWLHEKINRATFTIHERKDGGICLLQHSLDVSDAIIILLQGPLPGPAWTLARPLLESFVRGVWILHCASDEQVEKFYKGKVSKFPKLLKAMDNHDEAKLHAAWIRAQMANEDIFHDFTHGGIEHVIRRITENEEKTLSNTVVQPNYPEHELKYLVRLGTEVNIRVGCELLPLMSDSKAVREAVRELYDKAAIVRPRP